MAGTWAVPGVDLHLDPDLDLTDAVPAQVALVVQRAWDDHAAPGAGGGYLDPSAVGHPAPSPAAGVRPVAIRRGTGGRVNGIV